MHPDHLELILKLLHIGMALICGIFLSHILKAAYNEYAWLLQAQ